MPKDIVAAALDNDLVPSAGDIVRMKATLARTSGKARKRAITGLLLQGMTPTQLADVQGRPHAEVEAECLEAIEEASREFGSFPEGAIILSHVALEGYSTFLIKTMKATDDAVALARAAADPKAWDAASKMLRLSRETMNDHLTWMQKFGLLPNYGRGPGRPKAEENFGNPEDRLAALAEQSGTSLEELDNEIIASASAPKPVEVAEED